MTTTVTIEDHQIAALDKIAAAADMSREEAIQDAVSIWLNKQENLDIRQKTKLKKQNNISQFAGMWGNGKSLQDGVDYQRKIRADWD